MSTNKFIYIIILNLILFSCYSSDCLTESTLVLTPAGENKIENIKAGDYVISFDSFNNRLVKRAVIRNKKSFSYSILDIHLSDGKTISVTSEHPFYNPNSDSFHYAGGLSKGDLLKAIDRNVEISKIKVNYRVPLFDEKYIVYNLTIGGPENNFYANGVLVHNKTIDCDEKEFVYVTNDLFRVIDLIHYYSNETFYFSYTISNSSQYNMYGGSLGIYANFDMLNNNIHGICVNKFDLPVSSVIDLTNSFSMYETWDNITYYASNCTSISHFRIFFDTGETTGEYSDCLGDYTHINGTQNIYTNYILTNT